MIKFLLFFGIYFCLIFTIPAQKPVPDSTQTTTNSKTTANVDTTADDTEFQSTDKREKLPSWFYSVGLDGTASSGNVNRQLLNFKTTLHFENPKSNFGFFTNPKFQYGTNSDVLQEREIFVDLNTTLFYLKSNLYVLIFGAFEQNNLRKISSRYNVGAGVGWKVIGGNKKPKSNIKMSLTNAIVRENTDFEIKEDKDVFRNSTRLKLSVAFIPDKLILSCVIFYQPSLNDNYYRWNSASSLSYKVGKHLAIVAAFENTYENFNVVGIQNSQTNTTIGLTYSGSK